MLASHKNSLSSRKRQVCDRLGEVTACVTTGRLGTRTACELLGIDILPFFVVLTKKNLEEHALGAVYSKSLTGSEMTLRLISTNVELEQEPLAEQCSILTLQ